MSKKSINNISLIREDHPPEYKGYPFITLIQTNVDNVLCIVDNHTDKHIRAFVLDLCEPFNINEQQIVDVAHQWYHNNNHLYPISVEFSKHGLSVDTSKIYNNFNIQFITRVIGPLPKFNMSEHQSIKRKRRKAIPPGVIVKIKKSKTI